MWQCGNAEGWGQDSIALSEMECKWAREATWCHSVENGELLQKTKHSSKTLLTYCPAQTSRSQRSIFSLKHSSQQRAPITDTEPRGGKELLQTPERDSESVGGHRALLQAAGHTPGSAWQQFLSAGAWHHTVPADQLGCYDHRVKCPSLVTLNETEISHFSPNWVSGQATQCRASMCITVEIQESWVQNETVKKQ